MTVDGFGDDPGTALVGALEQNDEFLPAVAAGEIQVPDRGPACFSERLDRGVSGLVAIGVVDRLGKSVSNQE